MIVCAGQSLIDCIVHGDGVVADSITLAPGGEALNEAFTFAALGDEVWLSSGIGTDFAGETIRQMALKAGIHILGGYSGRTPVAILKVDATGNRKSTVSRIHELNGFVPGIPGGNIDCVVMGSLFRPPYLAPEAALATARSAKAAGALLVADTKMPRGSEPRLSDYADVLMLLDYITPNREEAEYYTGFRDPVSAAKVFRDYGVKNVIIKLSEEGVYVSAGDESFTLPAFRVTVADGVGAGDSFAAGFIHSLLKGQSPREAAVFGQACAAITVTGTGGVGALKSETQAVKFMEERWDWQKD